MLHFWDTVSLCRLNDDVSVRVSNTSNAMQDSSLLIHVLNIFMIVFLSVRNLDRLIGSVSDF